MCGACVRACVCVCGHSDLNLQATQVLPGDQQEKKKGGKGKGRTASSGKVRHTHTSSPSLSLPPSLPSVSHRQQLGKRSS